MASATMDSHIAAVRHFNRFHTQWVGALKEDLLESGLSLPQARLVYEIATSDRPAAADLAQRLGFDRGYLSRMVSDLEKRKLIDRTPDPRNAKRLRLGLTDKGQQTFRQMDSRSARQVEDAIGQMSPDERQQLVGAMGRIEGLLGQSHDDKAYLLRGPEPGDLGWVVSRHGSYYAREFGWDWSFEALVARIVADFADNFDASCERCWIAEHRGAIAGSVFIVREDDTTARLRMLFVEPSARGLGIGRRLVDECLRFARDRQYRRIVLWTESILLQARQLYEAAGFTVIDEKPHTSFGHEMVSETWALEL